MSRFALTLLGVVGLTAGALLAEAQQQPTCSWKDLHSLREDNVQSSRVTINDGVDHASGDAKQGCGFTAAMGESLGALTAAVFGLALLAFAGRKVRRR